MSTLAFFWSFHKTVKLFQTVLLNYVMENVHDVLKQIYTFKFQHEVL